MKRHLRAKKHCWHVYVTFQLNVLSDIICSLMATMDAGIVCSRGETYKMVVLKFKRKSKKSKQLYVFFSVAQKVMFDIKCKYQTQVSKINLDGKFYPLSIDV